MTLARKPITTAEKFIDAAPFVERGTTRTARRPVNLKFPPELLGRLDASARKLGVTRQAMVMIAVARYLEKGE
jgi:hypothetical protein